VTDGAYRRFRRAALVFNSTRPTVLSEEIHVFERIVVSPLITSTIAALSTCISRTLLGFRIEICEFLW
jgi:hypothetical protein